MLLVCCLLYACICVQQHRNTNALSIVCSTRSSELHIALCIALAALSVLTQNLQRRSHTAVKAEQDYEQQQLQQLYSRSSLKRLQEDGLVLASLTAEYHSTLYGNLVWRFDHGHGDTVAGGGRGGGDLPYHRMKEGDSVLVSKFTGMVRVCVTLCCRNRLIVVCFCAALVAICTQ